MPQGPAFKSSQFTLTSRLIPSQICRASHSQGFGFKPGSMLPRLGNISWFSSIPANECRDSVSNYVTTSCFHIISNTSHTNRPTIRRYI